MNQHDRDKSACEQEWPDSLDAMVAAPEHHEVLLENERVRVLDSRIKPGETVSGFLLFPFKSFVRARVVLIDRASDEPEGFSIEF